MSQITFLSAADVRQALPMTEAVTAMRDAFAQLAGGDVIMPARAHVEIPEHDGVALFMPSYSPTAEQFGIKVVNLFAGNPQQGLPRIQALVTLFDGKTGSPRAILDGTALTALRTGAVSGLATDLLAREDAKSVAIFGAGVQARTQLEAVCAVRPIERAWVVDPSDQATHAFAQEMSEQLGIQVAPSTSSTAALAEADIVCAATTSKTPVFDDADLPPGIHINAVGSYQPTVQEIPAETVIRSKLVVDHRESALEETGDLIIPISDGRYHPDQIYAELGEIVLGHKAGRTDSKEITFFKSVGVAVQDLIAGGRALELAEQQGLGQVVSM
jgi:ornithine cyclodeaminase/alanine dehydrogenase-like protein (mu-crystallin family)